MDIGQFQFALRNPENGRITILNLTNVTQTGFLLSNADIQISATVVTNANPSFIDEATNGLNVNALFAADTDGDRQVTLRATLFREAAFNNFVGFYVVDTTTGAVLNSSGSAVTTSATTVDRQTYLQAVINNTLLGGSAPVSGQTTALTGLLNFSGIATNNIQVLPYIIANGSPSNVAANFSNVYTPLLGANADLFGHIRRLSNNAYGFEDLPGGGDADFDDLILQIAALVDA